MRIRSSIAKLSKRIQNAFIDIDTTRKNKDVIAYGNDNALPQRIIELVSSSPTATAALSIKAQFIAGVSNYYQNEVNEIALSLAYFDGFALHILFNGKGEVAKIMPVPIDIIRVDDNGNYHINNRWGKSGFKNEETIIIQPFNAAKSKEERQAEIIDAGGLNNYNGELLYVFKKTPGNTVYPVPQYYAGIEDIESEASLLLNDKANITQEFAADFIMYTPLIDDSVKDEAGKTELDYFREDLRSFREPGERKILHLMAESKEQYPVIVPTPVKDIVEALASTRERIPRAICRHIGVPPMLVGFQNTEGFGNSTALANYMQLFKLTMRNYQLMIESAYNTLGVPLRINHIEVFENATEA